MPYLGAEPAPSALEVATTDIADDAVTLAKMVSGTDGNIISYDASGDPVAIATGSDGQVLTSTGAGSPPAFEAVSGGFEALIGSTVISNDATIDFTVDTTYDIYKFVIVDCVPATDNVEFRMRFGDSSGIDTGASDYAWFISGSRVSGATAGSTTGGEQARDNLDAQMVLAMDSSGGSNDVGSAAGEGVNYIIHVFANETSGGTMDTTYTGMGVSFDPAGICYPRFSGGNRHTPLVLTTVQFYFSSGNLSTGRITCFGLKHAA